MSIKIKYPEIKKRSKEGLLQMKKTLKIALMNAGMQSRKRDKGISPREVKKNIARINQRLNELE